MCNCNNFRFLYILLIDRFEQFPELSTSYGVYRHVRLYHWPKTLESTTYSEYSTDPTKYYVLTIHAIPWFKCTVTESESKQGPAGKPANLAKRTTKV